MRHIPLVGGFLSWFAPAPEPDETTGRAFDLLSGKFVFKKIIKMVLQVSFDLGKILKTENVYKSHKQVIENDSSSESNVSISTRVTRDSIASETDEAANNENNENENTQS